MKNTLRKILRYIYPELSVLSNEDICFSSIRNWENNVRHGRDVGVRKIASHDNVTIGNHTAIGQNSIINNTTIGSFTTIGPNFFCGWGIHPTDKLSTSPHIYSTNPQWTVAEKDLFVEHGPIEIGSDVFIGANVTVLENVKIGNGAVIGAGAVVVRDIPAFAIAVGVPAKVVKYRMSQKQIASMERIAWWNWPDDKIVEVNKYFNDIDGFISRYDGRKA